MRQMLESFDEVLLVWVRVADVGRGAAVEVRTSMWLVLVLVVVVVVIVVVL